MMKVFSKVLLSLIVLFLVGICVLEEVKVSSSLNKAMVDCFRIDDYIENKEDIREMKIVLAVDTLESNWKKSESDLCYLVNHKSIQEIGAEIARLKNYLAENDVKEFKASLEVVKFYADSYLHFMGASFHNIL